MLRKLLLMSILTVSVLPLVGCEDAPAATPVAPTPPPTPAPTPPPPPPPPPPEPAALDSLSINPSTVRSQIRPVATVTLTAAAPTGGAVVALSSGNPDIAKVPSGMTVEAGAMTGTFLVDTATVPTNSFVTIIASYAGVTKTAMLTVQPPLLEPRFNVNSPTRGTDACQIIDAAGSVDCTLDGGPSDGFVARYLWTLKVGSNDLSISTGNSAIVPTTTCTLLSGGTINSDGTVQLSVSLQLEDREGNKSSATAQRTVALYHGGRCGY
jgi:hypothetical protein